MKVIVLTAVDWDCTDVIGVFATMETLERHLAQMHNGYPSSWIKWQGNANEPQEGWMNAPDNSNSYHYALHEIITE